MRRAEPGRLVGADTDGFLATGFAGLDRQKDVSVFADCLRLLETLPDMRAIKDESLAWLGVAPGSSFWDF